MPIEPREALPRKEIVKRIQNYVRPVPRHQWQGL